MYAMRNLFVLHKHFLRYEYIAPQLSLGASLWRPSLCQHVRHHEIFQISCAWVGIAKGTHGHETSEFVTSSFCTTAHSKQSECATTFGMNSRFQLSKISCSISPSSHRNIILLDCWWRKKNPVLPNFILVISFTLYIMYIISAYLFPQVAWFHPNPSSSPGHWCPPAPRWARRAVAASRGHRSPWAAESWTKPVNHPWTNRSVLF